VSHPKLDIAISEDSTAGGVLILMAKLDISNRAKISNNRGHKYGQFIKNG
jgi:hypothetical protein